MADQVTTSLAQAKVLVMEGQKGADGKSPYIGANGNWFVWNGAAWVDTGISAGLDDAQIAAAVEEYLEEHPVEITVDDALSSTSENPVQNKVVKAALNQKGTYSKPSGGIPKTDLASDVQTSLGKADTALQSHQSLAAYRTASAQDDIDAAQDSAIAAKYTKPSGGIPASDLADGVIPAVPSASTSTPTMDGTAAVGTSTSYARGDHAHPSDTSKLGVFGNAYRSASIPMGHLDATSTATVMTAAVDGITELRDGVCMWLQNGVITSASGFTLNINNLGAKPCYNSLAAATRATTVFDVNYTMFLIYNSTRVDGGCWDIVYGYDTNTTYTPPKLGFGYGTCTTAAATAAKTASISSYALTTGGIVSIKFDNDVPASATLNISGKGARAIYYKGIGIWGGIIKAGDTATFVYSTYYHLISIDRDETADLTDYATEEWVGQQGFAYNSDLEDRTNVFQIPLELASGTLAYDGSVQRLYSALMGLANIWFMLPLVYLTGQTSNQAIRFTPTYVDADTTVPKLMLTSLYDGNIYSATLVPVSENRMEGALSVSPVIPVGGSTGDFLRKTASGAAWQTVPSAESNSFGGGA